VTDAAVALGWIDPDFFLGGRLALDAEAARTAIEKHVAEPLGLSPDEAAQAALTVATENIVGAIREITIAQGIDPREMTIVAGGGASGLNVVPIARELGCRRALVPSTAAALSACGALYSDVIAEFSRSRYAETRSLDLAGVNDTLADVEAEADVLLASLAELSPIATRKDFFVEARYRAQVWELDVPTPARLRDEDAVRALEEAFHETHERVFAVREPGQFLECLLWKVRATAVLEKPQVRAREVGQGHAGAGDHASAYFGETGRTEVPSYEGASLPEGAHIEGPAIIHEPTTTVVVYPDSTVTVTALGNYMLELEDVREREIAGEQVGAA
jgi:N-methylhydantoinase A